MIQKMLKKKQSFSRVRRFSKTRGSSRVRSGGDRTAMGRVGSGRFGSGGFQVLQGRVGSGQVTLFRSDPRDVIRPVKKKRLTHPYTTAACAAGVVAGTAGRDSSRYGYRRN